MTWKLKLQLHRRSLQHVVSNFADNKYVDYKTPCPGYTEFDRYDCICAVDNFMMLLRQWSHLPRVEFFRLILMFYQELYRTDKRVKHCNF